MLAFLTLILCCQLAGELFVAAVGLPVPGPVIGMALLFAGLLVHGGVPAGLGKVGDTLLQHLSLLFVPSGVGVLLHLPLIGREATPIATALVVSTLLTVAVTAICMDRLRRLGGGRKAGR